MLPSIPLSPLGGEIADAHDKAAVARRLKFAEIFVQLVAAAGFYFSSLALLYAALFGLGCIAALFGPIKYGILPDHLKAEELISGNALVEGATFAAIVCGLLVGGYAAAEAREPWTVVAQLVIFAAACYGASLFIPATGVGAPGLKVDFNLWTSTRTVLRELKNDDRQWVARDRGELVLDGRRDHARLGPGRHQVARRRRRRSRDRDQFLLRRRHRRRDRCSPRRSRTAASSSRRRRSCC